MKLKLTSPNIFQRTFVYYGRFQGLVKKVDKLEPDVNAFKSDAHLASWAGLYPGSYEGAGIKKSSHIRQGNRYIVNWNKIWTNQLGD